MTLHLYVLRQLLLSFAFALGGISFIVFPALTVSAVHKLQGAGVDALLRFLPLLAIDLVPYLVPMGFLLAVVATFGRLSADNEWTAIRMAGFHPLRVMLPGLVVALALAAVTGWLVSTVSPEWKHRQRSFKKQALATALRTLWPGRTRIQVGEFFLNASGRTGNDFREVLIYVPGDDEREPTRLVADEARLSFRQDVLRMEFVNARYVQGEGEFENENPVVELPLDSLVQTETVDRTRAKFRTSREILAELDRFESGQAERRMPRLEREYAYEFHRRNALSVTYVLFLVLGVPTGLWLRKGTQLGALAAAVGYALVYYVLSLRVGRELGLHGSVPVSAAAWSTSVLGLLAGALLCWRVLRR